tara:strand:+ start:164 stop:469 length:306 start_codon:yes stop_codon:yes gene_type:complete
MIIYVDIDETVCTTPENRDYKKATPMHARILKINQLFDEGNKIVYWTARGTGSGLDWRETTETQLKKWGAKYHELILKKPIYDLFICDKAITSDTFFGKDT